MKTNQKKPYSKKWTKSLLLVGSLVISFLPALLSSEEKKKEEPHKSEAPKAEGKSEPKAAADSKKAEGKESGGEARAVKATDENALFPEKEVYTREEVAALREVLDKKSTQLDQDIDAQVKYLESLKVQTEEHLKKIESARNEIADFMNTRDEKEEGKLKKLARFYEAMDAEQAAPLLKDVNDELAIKIFDRMDAKKAGTVLAQLPAPRAARLTMQFPKLRLQMGKTQQAEAQR